MMIDLLFIVLFSRAFMFSKDLFPYEKYKAKYGQTHKKHKAFNMGLIEIIENPDVMYSGQVKQCVNKTSTY